MKHVGVGEPHVWHIAGFGSANVEYHDGLVQIAQAGMLLRVVGEAFVAVVVGYGVVGVYFQQMLAPWSDSAGPESSLDL